MKWLDNIPLIALILIAVVLGIAPMDAEPHLVEKSKMLLNGTLAKPIDIFDLLLHGAPILLLLIRFYRIIFKPSGDDK